MLNLSLLTVQLLQSGEQFFQLDMSPLHPLWVDRLQDLCTPLEQSDQLVFSQHPEGKPEEVYDWEVEKKLKWLTSDWVVVGLVSDLSSGTPAW